MAVVVEWAEPGESCTCGEPPDLCGEPALWTIDLASLGGERWTYDSVIAAEDGKVTVLFFDEDD